jgi:hypothetical protein
MHHVEDDRAAHAHPDTDQVVIAAAGSFEAIRREMIVSPDISAEQRQLAYTAAQMNYQESYHLWRKWGFESLSQAGRFQSRERVHTVTENPWSM